MIFRVELFSIRLKNKACCGRREKQAETQMNLTLLAPRKASERDSHGAIVTRR